MNKFLPPRRVIPQWRTASYAVYQPDMVGVLKTRSSAIRLATDQETLETALASWEATRSMGDLADLLSFGVDPNLRVVLTPPALAAMESTRASMSMKMVAREILSSGDSEREIWVQGNQIKQVQSLRALLRLAPNDTIALVDLAQHHLTNGKAKAAYRCLLAALQISPDSIFVIRAFARYWVHVGSYDKAHHFIKIRNLAGNDPWLMASEIALAQLAQRPSTQLKRAQRALALKTFGPRDVTELAAAVGGTELQHGKLKEARKLFRTALDRPNDNVVAQTINDQKELGIEVDEQTLLRASHGVFEGRAYKAILEADYEAAARLTLDWGRTEPFSSRPKMLESYVNGALGDYQAALDAAELGLRADPADLFLRGNKAYALAGLSRLEEAESELKAINAKDTGHLSAFTDATKGMIELLRGNGELGLSLYSRAIAQFQSLGKEESVTTCRAFMARAALTAKIPESAAVLEVAKERYKKAPTTSAAVILRGIDQIVEGIDGTALRRVSQWVWDPSKNTLVEKKGLTRKGASGFVVKHT